MAAIKGKIPVKYFAKHLRESAIWIVKRNNEVIAVLSFFGLKLVFSRILISSFEFFIKAYTVCSVNA